MTFEVAMRMWFGEKAWGIAGSLYTTKVRNKWIRRWLRSLTKEVEDLDTDARHKERIMSVIDGFERSITRGDDPTWGQISILIYLVGLLLGRLDVTGVRARTPFYALEDYSHYRESGETVPILQRMKEMPTILEARLDIVNRLQQEGLPLWRIAQILNTTVYAIKKLKKEMGTDPEA